MQVESQVQEDPLQEEVAAHFNILAWKIPWMKEPGRLQSMGLHRVGHDLVTSLFPGLSQSIEWSSWCCKVIFEKRFLPSLLLSVNF